MKPAQRLRAIIEREDDGFVAFCPELDIASAAIAKTAATTVTSAARQWVRTCVNVRSAIRMPGRLG